MFEVENEKQKDEASYDGHSATTPAFSKEVTTLKSNSSLADL